MGNVAEFDREDTIEGIEQSLRAMGHIPERIGGIRNLAVQLVAGQRWDLVFNIAEGRYGAARESQVPALLDAIDPIHVLGPFGARGCPAQGSCQDSRACRWRAYGRLPIDRCAGRSRARRTDLSLFAKPVAEGTSRGITAKSVIRNDCQLRNLCSELLDRYQQPVLLESYLPGREFTIGVLGTGSGARSLGSLEVHMMGDADIGIYTYRNQQDFTSKVEYR